MFRNMHHKTVKAKVKSNTCDRNGYGYAYHDAV